MSHTLQGERPVDILLVEDNEADVRFLKEVLKEIPILTTLHVVSDGTLALAFLRKHGVYEQAPTPNIVLLDLFLPVVSGPEVFVEIKRDVTLAHIPLCLFVLDEHDPSLARIKNQGLQVECFLTKPIQEDQLMAILRSVKA